MDCGTAIVAPTVTRTGYTFKGWTPSVASTVPANDVTYTAQWKLNTYTVVFDANGGTGGTEMSFDHGDDLAFPEVSRKDYDFLGWFTAAAGGVAVVEGSAVTGDMTLYAHWELMPNTWLYEEVGGKATITGYSTPTGDIAVPAEIDGYPVVSIGTNAFSACTGLTGVTIPGSVTNIGANAFKGCSGLVGIEIPDSVTSMGTYAFYGCSGLECVKISDNLKDIPNRAFANCSNMTSLVIGDCVTNIDEYAFASCTGLRDLTLPSHVTHIRTAAFKWCSGLTSVTIPESLVYVGQSAFRDCDGLKSMHISNLEAYCRISLAALPAAPRPLPPRSIITTKA